MSDFTAGAPLGAEPVVNEQVNDSAVSSTPNTTSVEANPDPIEVSNDTWIKGADGKPVKFGDHVRGFQSQATRASQKAADLERKLQEREASLRRYEDQQRQSQRDQTRTGQPGQDPLQGLRSLPYTTGEDVANVVAAISQELQTRDQIILATLKQLQAIQQVVKPMYETSASSQFDSKIAGYLKDGNFPEEYAELAKELYLAYEPGPELDAEFPNILAARITGMERALENRRRQAAESARRAPFVPGRGGQASPSKPQRFNPANNAREDVDAIWEAIQHGPLT